MTTGWRLVVDGDVCAEGAEIEVTVGMDCTVARMPAAAMAGVGDSPHGRDAERAAAIRDLAANLLHSGCFVELVPPGELSRAEAAARAEGHAAGMEEAGRVCDARAAKSAPLINNLLKMGADQESLDAACVVRDEARGCASAIRAAAKGGAL